MLVSFSLIFIFLVFVSVYLSFSSMIQGCRNGTQKREVISLGKQQEHVIIIYARRMERKPRCNTNTTKIAQRKIDTTDKRSTSKGTTRTNASIPKQQKEKKRNKYDRGNASKEARNKYNSTKITGRQTNC